MKIKWANIALEQLEQVADYIYDSFGESRENIFEEQVKHVTNLLASNPYMGALEPLLEGRSESYRSVLVNRRSKMVYYIDENNGTIIIAAFWDCRSEPLTNVRHLE
ncbi:MAG: type II toxin-antitoxin system RelE/ParE family toxin [Bacteroidales bacterium]|nr:type II toxin-antitoxin system RelE/ParE family toxin [Bacteroidales bacterium]